jgi:hydrogenase expression/formation protein HypE
VRGLLPLPPTGRLSSEAIVTPESERRGTQGSPAALGAQSCPMPHAQADRILLGHGGGGRLTADLIHRLFRPLLTDATLGRGDDSGVLTLDGGAGRLAFTTDAHIVHPLEFPGGDIGRLAVCGTVNDLAMVGALPRWLSAAFIIEEGFETERLARLTRSLRDAQLEAGVRVVTADTKVAPRGTIDGLMICTAGIGIVPTGREVGSSNVKVGDAVLLSGPIGNHGIAVLAARGELAFGTEVRSDTQPLNGLVEALFASGSIVHAMRDPTRGGLAATLNELAANSSVSILLEEDLIPVDPEVAAACEMLGFDPMHVANEGKMVAFVPAADADRALAAMRTHPAGTSACRVGTVLGEPAGRVLLRTSLGPTRVVDMPAGDLLPRIC